MVVAALVIVPAAEVHADTPEQRANTLYNEGKELMAAGELRAAIVKFTEAWDAFKHPLILKKRAECHEKLLEYEEAIADYREYMNRLPSRRRQERRQMLERIQSLEALLQRPVSVTVVTSRVGVMVSVDHAEPRRTPFEVELVPGNHHAAVRDARFVPTEKTVRVAAGRATIIKLDAVPRTGRVRVQTTEASFAGVQVAIDSEPITLGQDEMLRNELAGRELVVGRHSVVCTIAGRPSFYVGFDVVEEREAVVVCKVQSPATDRLTDPWGWTTASLALTSLAAGTGLMISWALDVQKAKETNQDLITDKHIYGGVFLGLGAALGVATYFVFARNMGDEESAGAPMPRVGVAPLPGGALVGGSIRW